MPSKLLAAGLVLATIVGSSMALAQADTGAVTGTVKEGERVQPGLEVFLTDNNGKVQSKTITNEKGRFEFKDLQVGAYKLSAMKPVAARKGSTDVKVLAGKTLEVTITLLLQ